MDAEVRKKFDAYPAAARKKLLKLRGLIFEVAERETLGEVTETLKWGEPSYVTRGGSALRIDWKPKHPDSYSIYFNCNTKLISTFREVYSDTFQYLGNREIRLSISGRTPERELKACISMSLRYHKIKHLPLLGC